jgi:hypothetical protein
LSVTEVDATGWESPLGAVFGRTTIQYPLSSPDYSVIEWVANGSQAKPTKYQPHCGTDEWYENGRITYLQTYVVKRRLGTTSKLRRWQVNISETTAVIVGN